MYSNYVETKTQHHREKQHWHQDTSKFNTVVSAEQGGCQNGHISWQTKQLAISQIDNEPTKEQRDAITKSEKSITEAEVAR